MSGFVDPDYIYGIHILKDAGAIAFRWHEPSNTYQSFNLSLIDGNVLELPLLIPSDAHYALSIGCDDDDVLHIMGNHHDENIGDNPTHYVVCNDVSNFTSAASWDTGDHAHAAALDVSLDGGTNTYHHLERMTDGTLLWFQSQSEERIHSEGRDWLAFKRVSGFWVPIVGDGHFATTEDGPATEADRVYVCGIHVERRATADRVHVFGIWRTGDVDPDTQQQPWYLYSDDLSTWRNIDGTAHPMPITWANRASAQITSAPPISAKVGLGIYVDPSSGFPAVTVKDGVLAGPNNFVRLYWNGASWASEPMPVLSGEYREHVIKGERWIRYNSTGRVALRRASTGQTIRIGGEVRTSREVYSANPDPVWLRQRGVYAVNVGDGDAPIVYTFGNGPRFNP